MRYPRTRDWWTVPAMLFAVLVACRDGVSRGAEPPTWRAADSRVFIVSLAQFANDRLHSFSPSDRLDDRLAEVFRQRGAPAAQVLLVKDQRATTQKVRDELAGFLRKSRPGETLF